MNFTSDSFVNKPIKSTSMTRVLKGLRTMLDYRNSIIDPEETVRFTAETRAYILRYADQVKSRFIREKCESLPELSLYDFRNKKNDFGFWTFLFSSDKDPVRNNEELCRKIDMISYGIESILQVIENPELEKMYYKI